MKKLRDPRHTRPTQPTPQTRERFWLVYDPDHIREGAKFVLAEDQDMARRRGAEDWSYEGSEYAFLVAVELTDPVAIGPIRAALAKAG